MTRHLPYDRAERVSDEIYRVVAEAIINNLDDPRIARARVTRVRMTKDLRIAYLYVHIDGATEEERSEVVKGFKSSSGFIKRCIAREVKLRFMPEVRFFYDDGIDAEERLEKLLRDASHKS